MKHLSSLIALAATVSLHAQTFNTWGTGQGLPNADVRDVAVAPDGKIWVATASGIASFDGTTFNTYSVGSHPTFLNDDTYAIEVLDNGDVWVGTDFGLSVLQGSTFTNYTTANGLSDNEIKNIKQAPNGDVWLATINGATRFSASTFTAFGSPSIPFGGTTHVAFASNGDVLLSGGLGGVLVYNGTAFTAITTTQGLLSNRIRSIAVSNAQEKWVGTADGISVLSAANTHIVDHEAFFVLPPPDELNPVTDMLIDNAGRVWAAVYVDYLVTEGGVSVYADNAWSQYEEDDGLAGPNVRRLAMDAQGDIWVATSTGLTEISGIGIGIEEHEAGSFRVFPNPAGAFIEVMLNTSTGSTVIDVLDASGRSVLSDRATGHRFRLDVASLRAGLYAMRIGGEVVRFMVER
ncbi:MAG: T9SS type A sorting domain-containing protein [Flavobacteriales bacterium]|jgi:ligand-binding sensor domain-containing protein|nr:T9SS type A sorting domain-containing protein [Flavobacteriales bacterium]